MRAPSQGFDRREFLRRGAALGLGAGAAGAAGLAAAAQGEPAVSETPRVRRRAKLGATGLEISDISFGGSALRSDERLVLHALERGVNYFDTAEGYKGGDSETTIGRALKGRRDDVLLASKTAAGAREKRDAMFAALEGSLRRLQTDHVDVYFNHAVNDTSRLRNDEWFEFADRAKQQGKIRFTGMSGHGGKLISCLDLAIDESLVDVVLVAHNFGQDPSFYEKLTGRFDFIATQPELPRVLEKAQSKGIGVIAMKTLRGARLNDMRPYEGAGATFAQAAFRWTLGNPHVDALIVTMRSTADIDEYLGASGWESAHTADAALLARYARRTASSQCRYGCDDCASACPAGVPIPEVLRTRMYAEDYGDQELARADYAKLGAAASPCAGCPAPCATACPHGLDIPSLTRRTDALLRG